MKTLMVVSLAAVLLGICEAPCLAQAAGRGNPPAPAAPNANQRRTDLENQLKSGNKAQIDKAYGGYKDWMAEDAKTGEMHFYMASSLFAPLADHAEQTLDLIAVARHVKETIGPPDMGYLEVMEAQIFYQQGRDAEAVKKIEQSMQADPSGTAGQISRSMAAVLNPLKKQRELAQMLDKAVAIGPGDSDALEGLLKQRITALNSGKDYPAALACAKSLFNVSSMTHTSDAITLLDRQFLLPNMEDRAQVEQFRREQTAGAVATPPGQAPRVSALMQSIKIDGTPYEAALAKMTDDSTAKAITRHVLLLLVADKGKEGLEAAKQSLAIATTPAEFAAAHELIARCYKAQDGTIGRANGWLAANPKAK
jgi:hypothetical protein